MTIPFAKIRGVKFHSNAKDEAIIAFSNGDYVKGIPAFEKLSVKNDQGTQELTVSNIDYVMRDQSDGFKSVERDGSKVWEIQSKMN